MGVELGSCRSQVILVTVRATIRTMTPCRLLDGLPGEPEGYVFEAWRVLGEWLESYRKVPVPPPELR